MRFKLYDKNGDFYEYNISEMEKDGIHYYRVDYRGDGPFTPAWHLCDGAEYETESGACYAILNEYSKEE